MPESDPASPSSPEEDRKAQEAYDEALRRIREKRLPGNRTGDLDLSKLGLRELPTEIGQLSALQLLDLSGNALRELPPEIGQLSALQQLVLSNNALRKLPPEIGLLSTLEVLVIQSNALSLLPPEIGQLSALQALHLDSNELGELPIEIGQLSALALIGIINNALRELPLEIRQLSSLRRLWLGGNPALNLPPGVVKDFLNPRAIIDYYFSQAAPGARPLNEVKLLLVGRGGAGKTSIVERLVHDRFNPREESTTGIALQDWELKCSGIRQNSDERPQADEPNGILANPATDDAKKTASPITVHVWDFAGQVIAHATHQFFLSARSVYILVLTAREDSQREDAEYWLRLIRAFGTDRSNPDAPVTSRVIVALNKWDSRSSGPVKIDREALREKYPFIVDFVETDCESGTGIDRLQHLLAETAAADKWVTGNVGAEFHRVKTELERRWKQETGKNYLAYAEYEEICASVGVEDTEKRKNLAVQLHCLGLALNYGDDARLRDTTVLNPDWVIDGIYELLRRAPNERGVLSLDAACRQLPAEPTRMVAFLIRLMEKYDLVFPLQERDQLWLVPQALPDQQPKLDLEKWQGAKATRLRWTYAALPEGLLARFITRTHTLSEGRERWLNGVILDLAGAEALVRADPTERRIDAVVIGSNETERQQLAGLAQTEMRELNAEIKGLDPLEELGLRNVDCGMVWLPTTGLEEAEREGETEIKMLTPEGTLKVDLKAENDRLSAPDARKDEVWKPRVFVSYSHADDAAKDQLTLKLKVLKNAGLIEFWTDRVLSAGSEWNNGVGQELEEMDVFVLLVSDHSLTSDYIQREELTRALERRAAGEVEVIPVILQRCAWASFDELAALQALPPDAKPIRDHKPQSVGWHEVSEGLMKVFAEMKTEHAGERRVS